MSYIILQEINTETINMCRARSYIYEKYNETGSSTHRNVFEENLNAYRDMRYTVVTKQKERERVCNSNEISWESCRIQAYAHVFSVKRLPSIQGSFSTHDQSPSLQIYFQKALCTCNCS